MTPNDRAGHWAVRATASRETRGAVAIVGASARIHLGAPRAVARRLVELCYCVPPREAAHPLDPDNLVSALKPCIDGLRDSWWILDDRPGAITLAMPTQARADRRELRVRISMETLL